MKGKNKNIWIFALGIIFLLVTTLYSAYAVEPFGASVTPGTSQRAAPDAPQSVEASAGNVTELNINGYSLTQSWQGYFGEVTGTIQLSNAADNAMYNWSLASPRGEVYASRSDNVLWNSISCFNLTANGPALETEYNISSEDVDGVDETFSLNDHQEFFTNNFKFTEGQCSNVKLYGGGGVPTFDEVLMTDGTSPIFTSVLRDNAAGFDGVTHDFEMLVLENGRNGDTSTTEYYFYVELE